MHDRTYLWAEFMFSACWHLSGYRATVPAMFGVAASLCSAAEGGEPLLGVAATTIHTRLITEDTRVVPVIYCILVYIPLKSILRNKAPAFTMLSPAVSLALLYVGWLVACDYWSLGVYDAHQTPQAKFFSCLTYLEVFFDKTPTASFKWIGYLLFRTFTLAAVMAIVPDITSPVAQLCAYYAVSAAIIATIRDVCRTGEAWVMWQVRAIARSVQEMDH